MPVNLPMSMAAGTTFGMSDTILPLLVEKSGRPCFIYNKLALLRDESIDGELCYQLRDIYTPTRIWVSQKDFTVRRCESDGCAPLETIVRSFLSTTVCFAERLAPKSLPKEYKSYLEANNTLQWSYHNIQYNQPDLSSFPDFEFTASGAHAR